MRIGRFCGCRVANEDSKLSIGSQEHPGEMRVPAYVNGLGLCSLPSQATHSPGGRQRTCDQCHAEDDQACFDHLGMTEQRNVVPLVWLVMTSCIYNVLYRVLANKEPTQS